MEARISWEESLRLFFAAPPPSRDFSNVGFHMSKQGNCCNARGLAIVFFSKFRGAPKPAKSCSPGTDTRLGGRMLSCAYCSSEREARDGWKMRHPERIPRWLAAVYGSLSDARRRCLRGAGPSGSRRGERRPRMRGKRAASVLRYRCKQNDAFLAIVSAI